MLYQTKQTLLKLRKISPDLKNKVISTGWEIARDWLLLCSRAPSKSHAQRTSVPSVLTRTV
uniref:Uncharacterized protein n=2 Tax=Timema TaxID=61471 RepID=A0A7R9IFI7_9NEOP|nr:unnamed protein product [Timema bartmani]CAD7457329.1 unnamed protein product [Timema tahoe]